MKSNTEGWSNSQLNNRIDELEQKLEDFKDHLDAVDNDKKGFRFNISHDSFNDLMENLYKILDAEG